MKETFPKKSATVRLITIPGPAQRKVAVSKEFVGEIGNAATIRRRFKNPGKAGTIGQKAKARSLSRMRMQKSMDVF